MPLYQAPRARTQGPGPRAVCSGARLYVYVWVCMQVHLPAPILARCDGAEDDGAEMDLLFLDDETTTRLGILIPHPNMPRKRHVMRLGSSLRFFMTPARDPKQPGLLFVTWGPRQVWI